MDRPRAQIVTRTGDALGRTEDGRGRGDAISASPRQVSRPIRPLRRRASREGAAGNDAPHLPCSLSHTYSLSAFRKLKNAHVPRRRPNLSANHKHKRVKHTTADSRARPPTFVPRFTHSSFLTVSPLSLTLTCSFSFAHSSPLSFSYSPASVPRTHSRHSIFSLTPPPATSATASEARSTLQRSSRDTHRRDRPSSLQSRAPNFMRAVSFSRRSLQLTVPEAFTHTYCVFPKIQPQDFRK